MKDKRRRAFGDPRMGGQGKDKRKLKNFRLSPTTWWLVYQIKKLTGSNSEADIVERLIREEGRKLGLSFTPPQAFLDSNGLDTPEPDPFIPQE